MDIVERLRAAMPECCYPAELAADEIERLRAEVEALRADLAVERDYNKLLTNAAQERDALRADACDVVMGAINRAHIMGSDAPHVVVEKLIAAIDAARKEPRT